MRDLSAGTEFSIGYEGPEDVRLPASGSDASPDPFTHHAGLPVCPSVIAGLFTTPLTLLPILEEAHNQQHAPKDRRS